MVTNRRRPPLPRAPRIASKCSLDGGCGSARTCFGSFTLGSLATFGSTPTWSSSSRKAIRYWPSVAGLRVSARAAIHSAILVAVISRGHDPRTSLRPFAATMRSASSCSCRCRCVMRGTSHSRCCGSQPPQALPDELVGPPPDSLSAANSLSTKPLPLPSLRARFGKTPAWTDCGSARPLDPVSDEVPPTRLLCGSGR